LGIDAMRAVITFGLVMLSGVVVYFGSYFALVQRGWGECQCGFVSYYPIYRFSGRWPCGIVGTLYEPAHRLDQRLLRTKVWGEQQDLAAVIAVDLARNGASVATNSVAPKQHPQQTPP
jgi:hypothetical protein